MSVTTHRLHSDVHEYGLADDCPRCEEHARDPIAALDADMIASLYRRVALNLPPRSENEAIAMTNLPGRGREHAALSALTWENADLIRDRTRPGK